MRSGLVERVEMEAVVARVEEMKVGMRMGAVRGEWGERRRPRKVAGLRAVERPGGIGAKGGSEIVDIGVAVCVEESVERC